MDFFDVLEERRSIRVYDKRELEEEQIRIILECARSAPSAGNLQPYEIVVVRSVQGREALCRAALDQHFIAEAAVALVFFQHPARSATDYGSRGRDLYCIQDTAVACAYAQLAATRLGLGTCWVGAFQAEAVSRLLEAPQSLVPAAILSVGHPAEQPHRTSRRALSDLVRRETF